MTHQSKHMGQGPPVPSIRHKPLEHLWAHWRELPRANMQALPMRRSLDLSALSDILPRISLMRRMGPYEMIVGLVGTAVTALWDRPITGVNAFDLTAPSMRENAERFYSALLQQPAAAILHERISQDPNNALDVSTLYLPLCDKMGEPCYIIGCSIFSEPSNKPTLASHLITGRHQLTGIEFLDIGKGCPKVHFDQPSDHPAFNAAKKLKREKLGGAKWWQRFLPTGLRPAAISHKAPLDS